MDTNSHEYTPKWQKKAATLERYGWTENNLRHLVYAHWNPGVQYVRIQGEKENRFCWQEIDKWMDEKASQAFEQPVPEKSKSSLMSGAKHTGKPSISRRRLVT
jgi:hypothetical protein